MTAAVEDHEIFWQRGYMSARQLISNNEEIDSIIAYDDNVALGAMKYLYDNEIRIPQDVAVTGFDNQPFSEYSIPSLTTVDLPTGEIGKLSVSLIDTLLSNRSIRNRHVYIQPSLIIREST